MSDRYINMQLEPVRTKPKSHLEAVSKMIDSGYIPPWYDPKLADANRSVRRPSNSENETSVLQCLPAEAQEELFPDSDGPPPLGSPSEK